MIKQKKKGKAKSLVPRVGFDLTIFIRKAEVLLARPGSVVHMAKF